MINIMLNMHFRMTSSKWIVVFFLWKESHFPTALASSALDVGLGTLALSVCAFANISFPSLLSNIFFG